MIWDFLTQADDVAALVGFGAGYLKSVQMNKHELKKMKLQANLKSLTAARKDKDLSSICGRFLLVGGVLFIVFYIICVTLAHNIPITIESLQPTGWFDHLFHGSYRTVYTTLRGAVIPEWMPTILVGSMTYWFGVIRS